MTLQKQTSTPSQSSPAGQSGAGKGGFIGLIVLLIVFSVISFRVVWSPNHVLFTTDDNMGALMLRKRALPYGFFGGWNDHTLVGIEDAINLNWTNLLLWALPVRWFANWIHAIDLCGASVFLALFLRRRGVNPSGIGLGVLTAFWLGSNLTLTYAGHIGKFGVLMFAALTLWLIERAVALRRTRDWVAVGGGFAGMFLEQADVALFFSFVLGPYLLFAMWRENMWRDGRAWLKLVGMASIAAVMASRALWLGYHTAIQDVASVRQEDPGAKWEFLTQWSWPPEESIDFIAPGYMGWRSGEPAGPYWGRMGRSAGWEATRQGFQNFKLENQYLGFVPLAFAALAIWLAFTSSQPRRRDIAFWSIATLITLLLAFGKYFPLYRLFAMLPVVSSIRNPNKFLQVFQLGVSVSAAYGLHALVGSDVRELKSLMKWPIRVLCGGAAIILLAAFSATSSMPRDVGHFSAQGWGPYADTIVKLRVGSLWYAAGMAVVCLSAWLASTRAQTVKIRRIIEWSVVGVVAFDSLWLGRHYIQAMPRAAYARSPVVEFLLKKLDPGRRVALATQQGFYNFWLTYTFPYESVRAVNVTQMPRMPVDYQQFLQSVGKNVARLWQLFAVQYVVMPTAMWDGAKNDPQVSALLEPVYAFDAKPSPDGYYLFTEKPVGIGQHTIFQLKIPAPFMVPIGKWKQVEDLSSALRILASPQHDVLAEALLALTDAKDLTPLSQPGPNGEVRFIEEHAGYRRVQVAPERASIVRFAQRYTRDWKVEVDRKPARLLRCDYLFQGVEVKEGLHEIVLRYSPPQWPLFTQCVGSLAWVFAVIGCLFDWRKK